MRFKRYTAGIETLLKGLTSIPDGGKLVLESGAVADLEAGSALKLGGVQVSVNAAQMNLLAQGVAAGYKLARGLHTTVAASDTIVTGLATVIAAVAVLEDDPSLNPLWVQACVGDQAGAPAAGSILLKSWRPTANNNVTPLAATTFGKKVSWIAIGT
jgi:hypothetical protein